MSNTTGSTSPPLNAVIIGCGAIAGGYDENQSTNARNDILTHAKAYREHPGFTLTACVEPDENRRAQFMKAWNVEAGFVSLQDLLASGADIEAVSICTPTGEHEEALTLLLDASVKGVMCEKPLTDNLDTSTRLVEAYDQANVALAVNYLRRWDTAIEQLKDDIAARQWGSLQTAVCHYGKGIRHNGGHMIDIMQFLFGTLTPQGVLGQQTDFSADDPTLDAVLETKAGATVKLIGTDSRLYDVFEATLTFETGQIVLEEGMNVIRERPADDNPRFAGHKSLKEGTRRDSAQGRALYRALDNLYKAITENAPLASDGHSALATQTVCENLLMMADTVAQQS